MIERILGVSTDCVCDLPNKMLEEYDIDIIPFHILTDSGCFRDTSEITSENVLGYIDEGHKTISVPPTVEEYNIFFEEQLKKFKNLIHITISSEISRAYGNAIVSAEKFDGRVTVFDSCHLSTGMGHLVLKAAKLAKDGKSVDEIIQYLSDMKLRTETSFVSYSADYLYYNERINKNVAKVCKFFGIHPILTLTEKGNMTLGGVYFGNYERAAKKYIAKKLKKSSDIDRNCIFITHAGCSSRMISVIKNEVEKYNRADNIEITKASATVSSNCGPNAFGVLFFHEKNK